MFACPLKILFGPGLFRLCFCSPLAIPMCCIALGTGAPGQKPKHEIFGPVLLSKCLSYSRSAYYALVAAHSASSFAGVVYGRSP